MNTLELKQRLDELGINPASYNIGNEGPYYEAYYLEREGMFWTTYYFERGDKVHKRIFLSEEEACASFLEQMERDLSTRLSALNDPRRPT